MKSWVGYFMAASGLLMAGMWAFFLFSDLVPEIHSAPYTTASHLMAEFGTAILLVAGGLLHLNHKPQAEKLSLLALGMYFYAVIQAAGYYFQQEMFGFVAMFAVLLIFGSLAVLTITRSTTANI
jgi:uncharacterized membrane protein